MCICVYKMYIKCILCIYCTQYISLTLSLTCCDVLSAFTPTKLHNVADLVSRILDQLHIPPPPTCFITTLKIEKCFLLHSPCKSLTNLLLHSIKARALSELSIQILERTHLLKIHFSPARTGHPACRLSSRTFNKAFHLINRLIS